MTAATALWSVVDVESFIDEYYDAWSGTDEDRIMSYYAENVVLQIPGTLMEGKAALCDQFVRPFITAFPGNRHFVKNMIFGPGVVTVEWSFEARHKGPFAGHAATGALVKVPGCGVYEYDAEKRQIIAGRIYFDVGTLLQTIMLVNDHQKAAEALHLNERNLSVIINTIPTTAWATRPDGYCDFLNQRWLDYAGMTAEQAAGWGWAEAIHPDDRQSLVEYWQSALASGVPVETEGRMRRFDGSYRRFLFRANPVRNESGKIVKWYGTNIDIEDRRRGEEALRASELSWRQTVDNIPGFVATMGATGEVEFLNRQTLEYFGRTNEDLKNWSLIGVVHPDDRPRVFETRIKSIETGQIYEIEHRCRRADGGYRWFQVRGLPVRNVEGTITAWCLLLTDIDDLKRTEDALQSSERNLSLTIDTISTFIQVSRPDGTVLSVNQAVLDYYGVTLQEIRKADFRSRFYHPDDVERLREERREAFKRPVPFESEQRALGKDGKYRWFLVRYNPLLDDQGRIDRWYATAFDIEDRRRAEGQLRRSEFHLAEGQRLSQVGSWAFNSKGFSYWSPELFRIHGLDPSGQAPTMDEYLGLVHPEDREFIAEATQQMFVDGRGFDYAKRIVRPDGEIRRVRCVGVPATHGGPIQEFVGTGIDVTDQDQLTEELRRSEAFLAEGQRLSRTGSFSWRAETDEIVWSEEVYRIFRFEQGTPVTLELIGSRVHPEDQATLNDMIERGGELKISARREDGEVTVSVSDTGVGIPVDKMEQIFNAYFATKTEGTGMGLAISRTIIESHGGRLWATVSAESGATFHFTLPAEPEEHP